MVQSKLIDSTGTVHYEGTTADCNELKGLLFAHPCDVSEDDEVKFGDKLHIEWRGKLRVVTPDNEVEFNKRFKQRYSG